MALVAVSLLYFFCTSREVRMGKRVLVMGLPGSGKSYLSSILASLLNGVWLIDTGDTRILIKNEPPYLNLIL